MGNCGLEIKRNRILIKTDTLPRILNFLCATNWMGVRTYVVVHLGDVLRNEPDEGLGEVLGERVGEGVHLHHRVAKVTVGPF